MKRLRPIQPKTNTIFRGDNLEIMRAMPDDCVDLVYIDPPFFTEMDYQNIWGDKQSVQDFQSLRTVFSDKSKYFENSIEVNAKGLDAYLYWMRLRLSEVHRLLKPTGFFFMHIDFNTILP